jgi:spoIIIJ-associated protein
MSSSESIETNASTVDEAIRQALAQLGAQEDAVTIEVLSTPRAGVLGLGARQARVRVTRRAPEAARSGVMSPPPAPPMRPAERRNAPPAASRAPKLKPPPPRQVTPPAPRREEPAIVALTEGSVEEDERAPGAEAGPDLRRTLEPGEAEREASAILAQILELMGEKAQIEVAAESDPEAVELNIKGDGSGILIGRHGQTLDALEYLVNRMLARRIRDVAPIAIDTESYRARRRQQLHRMALSKGEQAKREHAAVTLDPMPPRDRRIIHLALKDDPLLTTHSAGDGFLRAIQIVPVDERREGGGGARGARERGRERAPERERDREGGSEKGRERGAPLGEQGGFKHGQKRIV